MTISTIGEARAAGVRAAAESLDTVLLPHGFKRAARSLKYKRQIEGGTQQVHCDFTAEKSGSAFLLAPTLFVSFPEVNALARKMMQGSEHLLAGADTTFRADLQQLVEHGRRVWNVADESHIPPALQDAAAKIGQHLVPVAEEVGSLRGYTARYRRGVDRPSVRDAVFAGAALLLLDERQEAVELLTDKIEQSGPTGQLYRPALEYARTV